MTSGNGKHRKQKVLFVSDMHIGASTSNFLQYESSLLREMKKADHIIFAGDAFELFYLDRNQYAGSRQELPSILRDHSHQNKAWLDRFMEDNPRCHLHFVMGNHENLDQFRTNLDQLHDQYHDRFTWDPEAIRFGDALVVHGDLQTSNQNDLTRRKFTISDAKKYVSIGGWAEIFHAPGQAIMDRMRNKKTMVPFMYKRLIEQAEKGKIKCLNDEGDRVPLLMDGVKHVFFGHTHVKFNNEMHEGISFHNLGAFTHVKSRDPGDIGVLSADLQDGQITNVSELGLKAEKLR